MSIRGARHYLFVMLPLLVTDYLTAFFDQALKGQPSPLLAGSLPGYPKVILEKHSR